MLLNEVVENTKSMRLTLKDISSVAKDFVSIIKLLTIEEPDTFTTGSIIVFHIGATSPLPPPNFYDSSYLFFVSSSNIFY